MWNPELLSITIRSTQSDCTGWASPSTQVLFSNECGEIDHSCTVPVDFEFDIFFHVDVQGDPRSTPFTPPELTLDLRFIDHGGGLIDHIQESDNQPTYTGAGNPLEATFGTRFTINTTNGVTLKVHLEMNDIDSGEIIIYSDTIECNILPCD